MDSTAIIERNKKRVATVVAVESGLYVTSMAGLYIAWYRDYDFSSFHTFNDGRQWLAMDKIGHATTAYYLGVLGIEALKWAEVPRKKATWYGGMLGMTFLTTIEVFDGFSDEWGFSWPDMAYNAAGTGLAIGQDLLWQEQRVLMKFSFTRSPYARYRPDLLGNAWGEEVVKDYNGQTYWLSANIADFMPAETRFPKWLNVAVGYGADGMLGGEENPETYNELPLPNFDRRRQFYFSLDVDLTKIPTRLPWLKAVFNTVGFLKFPAPTLEFREGGRVIAHGFYW